MHLFIFTKGGSEIVKANNNNNNNNNNNSVIYIYLNYIITLVHDYINNLKQYILDR
jgi:hypothetical protein